MLQVAGHDRNAAAELDGRSNVVVAGDDVAVGDGPSGTVGIGI